MQIVEISEAGEGSKNNDIAVGIDFGTTNSLIAFSEGNRARIIKNASGREIIPSLITIDNQSNKFIIGEYKSGSHTISSIKRLLAKPIDEIASIPALSGLDVDSTNSVAEISIFDKKFSLTSLAAEIFSYLKKQAESDLGFPITKSVVSVPAYFNEMARGQVMLAARIAGLEVIRLIAEPTAAAYAYGLNKKVEGTYLVYDLGGGTFDVSILDMQSGILQVIATGGDNMLGGDDVDLLFAEFLAKEAKASVSLEIIKLAKDTKQKLTSQENVEIKINDHNITVTQERFEQIIEPLINKTMNIAKNVLHDADNIKLDGIILVGGSTRMPIICKKLKSNFKVDIFSDVDPDKAVAFGTALQAENLTTNSNSLLIDVVPLSLGLELYGGLVEKITLRNTPMPFAITREFTTQVDNQTAMQFRVFQGEREMAKDCQLLAEFELKEIPHKKAGMVKIEVTFAIDADGILTVTAKDNQTGRLQDISIKPSFGLSKEEINSTLQDAFSNAKNDHENKLLLETRLQANELINGITKALKETPDVLTDKEQENIATAIKALQKVINLDNRDEILLGAKNLNNLAADFIQKHLNKGASMLIQGVHIDEVTKLNRK